MFKKATLSLLIVFAGSTLGMAQILGNRANLGFAVVTPLGTSVGSFSAVATLFDSTEIGVAQASVGPAPFLTSAVLPVNTSVTGGESTTLSFVSPALSAATVNLLLTNAFGVQVSNRTISVPGRNQVVLSVNDLLDPDAVVGPGLLLRITSNIPVAIQALDFRGVGFTAIPITNVAAAAVTGTAPTTPTVGTFTTAPTTPTTTTGGNFNGVPVVPIGVPIAPIGVPICIAPTVFVPGTITVGAPATTAQFTTSVVTVGAGAFIFPEVVRGDGGSAQIRVGNLSRTATQVVRFDFFTSTGELIRSISNVAIAPQGFVVFSSEFDGIIVPQG
jgi:hypothetical protein